MNAYFRYDAPVHRWLRSGGTLLHEAVFLENEPEVMRLLQLSSATKQNVADNDGYLPLHYACGYDYSLNIAHMLLDAVVSQQHKDSPWNLRTKHKQTALHLAVLHNHKQLTNVTLGHEIYTTAKLVRPTPHCCCNLHCTRRKKPLNELNINDQDHDGNTALHYACLNGYYEICMQLLDRGAVSCLDSENHRRMSPLHFAAKEGHYDICVLLLGFQQLNAYNILKALTLACEYGHIEIVRYLVNNCTIDLRVDGRNVKMRNFLYRAIEKRQHHIVKYVLQESPLWHNGLCNVFFRDRNQQMVNSPMRALVREMPDMALQALNKCTDIINDTKVQFNYEFIDDNTTSGWIPEWEIWNGKEPAKCFKNHQRRLAILTHKIYQFTRNPQNNHVLSLMVKYDRNELLLHPLVSTLVDHKWSKFGRYFFLACFASYLFYLVHLTLYSTFFVAPVNMLFHVDHGTFQPFWSAKGCNHANVTWPLSPDIRELNQADVCRVIDEYRKPPYNCSMSYLDGRYFFQFAQLTLLIMSGFLLALKLVMLFFMHAFDDFLACCVYASTIAVTFPWHGFDCYRYGLLQSWTWQVASVNIVLAYTHLALKLELAPGIGIYVHILRNISATMIRVLAVRSGIGLAISDVGTLQDLAEAQQLKTKIAYVLTMERLLRASKLSFCNKLFESQFSSDYDMDGVLLKDTTAKINDILRGGPSLPTFTTNKSFVGKCLPLVFRCYCKVFVGLARYRTGFRTRLQKIVSEKNKLAEEIRRAKTM